MFESEQILDRFLRGSARDIDLTLRPAYRDLLAKFGNPHQNLPPVFHVAGTNGKGSTCAFLRAMLEAAGYRVHVYTSPHLVHFHERIRIAGELISEDELVEILRACEQYAVPGTITCFEAITVAAFVAFARHPADFVILETGLGGRLDATNIVDHPLATIITRLSFDHREYLGDSLPQIAREKAGIMRRGVPCFVAPQPDPSAVQALREAAQTIGADLHIGDEAWRVTETPTGFHFSDATRLYDLPSPKLLGRHQYRNAGLAIAALSVLPQPLDRASIIHGLQNVEWPARLQKIEQSALRDVLSPDAELWLDGGHNDSAGEVLAAQAQIWHDQDARPLHVICGMLTTKRPKEFLTPLQPFIASLQAVTIPDEKQSFTADEFVVHARACGVQQIMAAANVAEALAHLAKIPRVRVLICGSLYLAGHILRQSNPV